MPSRTEFAGSLRLAELTQAELADATGVSHSFVSLVEHGCHGVDVVRLVRLAAVFGIPLTELVDIARPLTGLTDQAA